MRFRTRVGALIAAALGFAGVVPAAQAADGRLIVGGTVSSTSEYPYAVHLDGTLYSCGGSLIAPEWVLTAGHCIALYAPTVGPAVPAAHITATVGRTDLRNTNEGTSSIGAAAFVHPLYQGGLVPKYDVALIRLATPITGYQTIKIAGPGEEATWAAGTMSTIIGWGETQIKRQKDEALREAQVPIIADADCTAAYQVAGPVSDFDPASMLCAGYLGTGGVDTCQGDSGGPLLVPIAQGGYRQAGITSWGTGCAEPDHPGVYARIGASILRDFVGTLVPSAIGGGATPAGSATTVSTSTGSGAGKKPRAQRRAKKAKKRSTTRSRRARAARR